MISTELASAVLETKVKSVKEDGNEIEFFGENSQSLGKYNIYEFVHKNIKTWTIVEHDVELYSSVRGICEGFDRYFNSLGSRIADSDIEAVVSYAGDLLNDNS